MAQPDYAALAKQHGGEAVAPAAVDYAALAAKHGGVSEAPDPETGVAGHVVSALANWAPAIGGMVGGMVGNVPGAALGGAAGEGYAQLIRKAREIPGAVVDVAKNIVTQPAATARGFVEGATGGALETGKQAAIQGGAQAVGEKIIGPALSVAGKKLMQSAVKPTLAAVKKMGGTSAPLIKTLLDEGIQVSPSGVAKLEKILSSTNDEIADALASSGRRVQSLRVASRLSDTARRLASQVNPAADLEAVSKAGEEFLSHPAISPAGDLSVAQAQALKRGTYQAIKKSYGQMANASVEAQKALARGLKEEIAKEVPEISMLNAKEGQILQALDAVGRRVAMSGNRDPVGFAWVTHNPVTFIAALLDRSPAVKSMLARGLYSSAGKAAKVAPQLIRAAVASLAAGDVPSQSPSPIAGSASGPAQALSDSSARPGNQ